MSMSGELKLNSEFDLCAASFARGLHHLSASLCGGDHLQKATNPKGKLDGDCIADLLVSMPFVAAMEYP